MRREDWGGRKRKPKERRGYNGGKGRGRKESRRGKE